MEYVYSLNDEGWGDFEDVVNDVNENNEAGTIVDVYKAEKQPQSHSDFISADRIIEDIQEDAFGTVGEFAEDYLEDVSESDKETLAAIIANWLDSTAADPRFWLAANSTKETIIAE